MLNVASIVDPGGFAFKGIQKGLRPQVGSLKTRWGYWHRRNSRWNIFVWHCRAASL